MGLSTTACGSLFFVFLLLPDCLMAQFFMGGSLAFSHLRGPGSGAQFYYSRKKRKLLKNEDWDSHSLVLYLLDSAHRWPRLSQSIQKIHHCNCKDIIFGNFAAMRKNPLQLVVLFRYFNSLQKMNKLYFLRNEIERTWLVYLWMGFLPAAQWLFNCRIKVKSDFLFYFILVRGQMLPNCLNAIIIVAAAAVWLPYCQQGARRHMGHL